MQSAGMARRSPIAAAEWTSAVGAAVLLIVLAWSYCQPLGALASRWWNEPDYLYGFLVPVFAGYLLWTRREMLRDQAWRGNWLGSVFIAAAWAMRWASAYYYHHLLDPASLVPCLIGVALLVGGWSALRWSWPAIVFLIFMIPLPGFLATLLSHPLQRLATMASTYLIQSIGIPAVSRGNIIVLSHEEFGVAEACNGLQMMMMYAAVSVGAAMVFERTAVEKLIIVLSAIPITMVANILRITATVVLCQVFPGEGVKTMFHDMAGWFMMPTAALLLGAELWVLDRAFVVRPETDALAEALAEARQAASASPGGAVHGGTP